MDVHIGKLLSASPEDFFKDLNLPDGIPVNVSDFGDFLALIFTIVYSFAVVAAVAYVIYAGYTIIMAAGDAQKFKKGTDTLVYAVAGLILVICAGLIVEFVANLLGVDDVILYLNLPSS